MKQVVSFDIDGVVAGGKYIPEWDRDTQHYSKLPLLDDKIPRILKRLSKNWNIYLVSTRRYEDALTSTRGWLERFGIEVAGVIVNVPRLLKGPVVEILKAEMHFDDDLSVVKMIHGGRGVLFYGPEWAYRKEDLEGVRVVNDWDGVERVLGRHEDVRSLEVVKEEADKWPVQMELEYT